MAGIYLHIPFCKSFCKYCDFYSVTDNNDTEAFVEALIREAEIRSGYLDDESVETIYFGGGTPSLLHPRDVEKIITSLRNRFNVSADPEITFEVNPDDAGTGYFKDLAHLGINRISLGIQSWDDKRLKYLGRRHNSAQSEQALLSALDAGFENISADLIYGVPGMTLNDFALDLEKTLSFPVVHLSAYHLTVEEGTKFGKMKKEGKLIETEEETSNSMFALLTAECGKRGFVRYEISNFAREGFFSKHNSAYWKQVSYLGLGPSAHSFNHISRQWNDPDLKKYIRSLNAGNVPYVREELDRITVFNEYIMTSLRTMWGINLDYVESMYDKELHDYLVNMSDKYIRYGLMRRDKNTLILTDQGMMISDNIITELIMER